MIFKYELVKKFIFAIVLSGVFPIAAVAELSSEEPTSAEPTVEGSSIEDFTVERVQREMLVHKNKEMGLEIWTEAKPEWVVASRLVENRNIFLTQSPQKAYPPASMSVTSFPRMLAEINDFDEYTEFAIKQGLHQFNLPEELHNKVLREKKQYGELDGVEVNFSTDVHGKAADVKIFIGRAENKGPVLLQLFTLEGAMPYLKEHIRRSWGNIKYLDTKS